MNFADFFKDGMKDTVQSALTGAAKEIGKAFLERDEYKEKFEEAEKEVQDGRAKVRDLHRELQRLYPRVLADHGTFDAAIWIIQHCIVKSEDLAP